MTRPPHLSKSKVIAGQQCRLRLWFECFSPELAGPPDPGLAAVFESGTEVGREAHRLFPGGVLVEEKDFARALARTRSLMDDAAVPAVFEAAYEHDRVRIRADVMERLGDGAWGLREVKSTAGVKETHLDDVAVQHYVVEGAGLDVRSIELIHVDTGYVRGDGEIDWRRFFKRVELTAEVGKKRGRVPALVADLHRTLGAAEAPVIEPWDHCRTPHDCEFWGHCTRDKPEDWIHHLPRKGMKNREKLRAAGVERIRDIPRGFQLNALAARIRDVFLSGREFVSPDLVSVLGDFGPPASYLDFETISPAIPVYAGTRPYERIPFQWSLHRLDGDDVVTHREFLADGRSDPRRALARALLAEVAGTSDPIIVYSNFESGVLKDLAVALPDLAPELDAVVGRLRDLLPVVRAHLYHPGFDFSFSLKSVAPALMPGFGYGDLDEITEGDAASRACHRLATGSLAGGEEARVRAALLAYCKRDTLALVELHRALRERSRDRGR